METLIIGLIMLVWLTVRSLNKQIERLVVKLDDIAKQCHGINGTLDFVGGDLWSIQKKMNIENDHRYTDNAKHRYRIFWIDHLVDAGQSFNAITDFLKKYEGEECVEKYREYVEGKTELRRLTREKN